jgi:hypothetical protein
VVFVELSNNCNSPSLLVTVVVAVAFAGIITTDVIV